MVIFCSLGGRGGGGRKHHFSIVQLTRGSAG